MNTIFDEASREHIKRDNRFAITCLISSVSAIIIFSLLFFALGGYMSSLQGDNTPQSSHPRALTSLGLEVISSFEEDGVIGHGVLHQGQALVAYEIAGTGNIIIGDMFSQHGTNLSELHKDEFLMSSITSNALPLLEKSNYVIDSDSNNGIVIYTITDPQCPFCLRLWDTMRPYVEKGEIELRHVLVGIQGEVSVTSAAAILEANSPHEMLNDYLSAKKDGNEFELPQPSEGAIKKVWENNEVMRAVGATGTPASYVIYPDGSTEYISGAFSASKVENIISRGNGQTGE